MLLSQQLSHSDKKRRKKSNENMNYYPWEIWPNNGVYNANNVTTNYYPWEIWPNNNVNNVLYESSSESSFESSSDDDEIDLEFIVNQVFLDDAG